MLAKLFAGAGLALALAVSPALADTTIHMLIVGSANQALWQGMGDDFSKTHPGVSVKVDFLDNESYKAKLPTLLQSSDRPDIIYSWAGGVMRAQIAAGYIKDISSARADLEKTVYNGPLGAYVVDGKLYGVPVQLSLVGIWYNKAQAKKAGVDPQTVKTWADYIAMIKKIKASGETPILMGGADKWPMHFYYSYLLMRIGGPTVLTDAEAGKNGGFNNPAFVKAGEMVKQLSDLKPYQEGWLGDKYEASAGLFGDGKGVTDLMGDWLLVAESQFSSDGKGLAMDDIGLAKFPNVAGGKGNQNQTFGGVQGFLVTADAPPEAVDFLKFMSTAAEQKKAAETGAYIPAVKGTGQFLTNPLQAAAAKIISDSTWHQNFLDQELGPDVGRVVNDMSVAVAAGEVTPAEAAQNIQQAWDDQ